MPASIRMKWIVATDVAEPKTMNGPSSSLASGDHAETDIAYITMQEPRK
jgi:hypothetical protein